MTLKLIQTHHAFLSPSVTGTSAVDLPGLSAAFFAANGDIIQVKLTASAEISGGGWFELFLYVNGVQVAGSIGVRVSFTIHTTQAIVWQYSAVGGGKQTIKARKGAASGTIVSIDPVTYPLLYHGSLAIKHFRPIA